MTLRVSETSAFAVRLVQRHSHTATYSAGLLTPTPVRFSHSTHTHTLTLPPHSSIRSTPPSLHPISSHPRPSHWLCLNATDSESCLERACDKQIRSLVREGTWFSVCCFSNLIIIKTGKCCKC